MGKKISTNRHNGFTIVELLVIIVVIAILAAITVVSYNSVTKNARTQSITADITDTASQLTRFKADTGKFPTSQAEFLAEIEAANSSGESTYAYTYNSATGAYCLAVTGRDATYKVESTNTKAVEGDCAAATPVTVTNRMKNPSLTTFPDFNDFTVSGATITPTIVTDGTAHSSATYMRLRLTSNGAQTLTYALNSNSVDSTLLPNTPYTLSAKIRPSKSLTFNAQFSWTSSGGVVTTDPPTIISAPANNWTTLHITGQSASHVTVRMVIATASGSTWATNDTLDIDSMMLTQGSTVYEFRDGSFPGWAWSGTANNSSSTGTTIPE